MYDVWWNAQSGSTSEKTTGQIPDDRTMSQWRKWSSSLQLAGSLSFSLCKSVVSIKPVVLPWITLFSLSQWLIVFSSSSFIEYTAWQPCINNIYIWALWTPYKERLEFFDSWALYWLGLRWGSVRKCLTPFWLLWEAMCCEKKQKGQALISKEDAPHEGKRERANTICHVRALPLNHFPVKLRSHCEWDKERVAEIGHPRAGQMWLRLSIFFSNWVFGNLGLTGNMVLINDYLVKNREHFSFHNEIGERLC